MVLTHHGSYVTHFFGISEMCVCLPIDTIEFDSSLCFVVNPRPLVVAVTVALSHRREDMSLFALRRQLEFRWVDGFVSRAQGVEV